MFGQISFLAKSIFFGVKSVFFSSSNVKVFAKLSEGEKVFLSRSRSSFRATVKYNFIKLINQSQITSS